MIFWFDGGSSLDHELAGKIIGSNYLRVNSPLGGVNRRLDDRSDHNLNKIIKMGEMWWINLEKKRSNF